VILCDTGPLVALIDRNDANHSRCAAALNQLPAVPLLTTWPCFTEAMHLLFRAGGNRAQNELWTFVTEGLLRLHLPTEDAWRRLRELMAQYADMPLDFADASLIAAAEHIGASLIFSIDSQLRAVRLINGATLEVIP
jgi:predicted nucleic acid-binding protein